MLNIGDLINIHPQNACLFELEGCGDTIEEMIDERTRLQKIVNSQLRQLGVAKKQIDDDVNFRHLSADVTDLIKKFKKQAKELEGELHELEEALILQRVMNQNVNAKNR